MGPKKFRSKKIWVQKIWLKNFFESNKFLVPKKFGSRKFLVPKLFWRTSKVVVWHIPDTFPTPSRCLPGTFQTPTLSPSPNKNLQAFSIKQNQVGILVLLVVTLENKVNSNSDQFKFVQLSSKSGWSLTKRMHLLPFCLLRVAKLSPNQSKFKSN